MQRLQKLALLLVPFKTLFLLLAIASAVMVVSSFFIFSARENNVLAVPALLAFLWSLMLFIYVNVFVSIENEATTKLSFWQRFKLRIKRFFLAVFVIFFILLALVSVVASFRMLNVWLG